MQNLITSIRIGFESFSIYAIVFAIPFIIVPAIAQKKINLVRIALHFAFLLYSFCLIALVFFPLPSADEAAHLTYQLQYIPFQFVADILRETPLVWNQPHTYLAALTNFAFLQVMFNIVMTVPFGMYLRYTYGLSKKQILLCSFVLTLFIEIGQLTGLFFTYQGSYRLCDVDDLMLNTLGGYLGYVLVHSLEGFVPTLQHFEHRLPNLRAHIASIF